MVATHTRAYQGGKLAREDFPVEDVSDWLELPDTLVWVDYLNPTPQDLHQVADELGLHELAVEDALAPHQRPKLDQYPTHLFFSCHAIGVDIAKADLEECEINAFVNERWIITVRKAATFPIEPVVERWDRSPDLLRFGTAFLLYGLIDVVVDQYFDAIQTFDDFYEDVSEQIFDDRPVDPSKQQGWFNMRRALVRFHRLAVPMREAISTLMRRDHHVVPEDFYPYLQDVYDHILRVTEATDSLRDLVAAIVETNLSLRDYRQNQVMKKVTSWAAIVAVPTLITGFYGMNVPYPGLAKHWGFQMSAVLMVVLSLLLYTTFKRKEWL